MNGSIKRAETFCERFGLRVPILLAPMASASPPSLSIAVANAGGLGASAVQIGTGFLRCPEAKIHPAWADALAGTAPEDTMVSRVFSGRAGRSIATDYIFAATSPEAPHPAPYPVQRGLTAAMRAEGQKAGDVHRMQAWAGQSAALAKAEPAANLTRRLWADSQALLAG